MNCPQDAGCKRTQGLNEEQNMRLDRIERDEEILIDVIQCKERPELMDTSVSCRTVDVSEHGMKLCTVLAVPVNTVLGLRLELSDTLYRLQGEVRWVRDEGMHYLGLMLHQDSPDYPAWNEMFKLDY